MSKWSIFRLSDRKQFDEVPQSALEWFYDLVPEDQRSLWLIWKDGIETWAPLSQFEEIVGPRRSNDSAPKPPPIPGTATEGLEITVSQVFKPGDELSTAGASAKANTPEAKSNTSEVKASRSVSGHSNSGVAKAKVERKEPVAKVERELKIAETPPIKTGGAASSSEPSQPVPASHRVVAIVNDDQPTLSLQLESGSSSEGRNNVRYHKRFRVKIPLPGGGAFETVTMDASMSGLRLRDPIPAGLPRFFAVEIDCGHEGKIPLMCSLIRERDNKPAHRLRIQVNDFQGKLKSALMRAA